MGSRQNERTTYGACGKCGYDVTNVIGTSDRCPECGSGLAQVGVHPRSGAPNRTLRAVLIIALLLVGGMLAVGFGVSMIAGLRAREAQQAAMAARAQAQIAAQVAAQIATQNAAAAQTNNTTTTDESDPPDAVP